MAPLPVPSKALVREVSASYEKFYAEAGITVDSHLVRRQHRDYVAALTRASLSVMVLEGDAERPDCVFVEDTAVVWGDHALIARTNSHREGEQPAVERALAATHEISHVLAPAALEGGDVLHTESVTFVGLSARTNELGAEALQTFLRRFGRRVIPVEVKKCLHLKSGATYLGDATVLVAPDLIDQNVFSGHSFIETAPGEAYAANCLRIGKYLLTLSGCPRTQEKLERFASRVGADLIVLECSEFRKGGGSLTCLSLIW